MASVIDDSEQKAAPAQIEKTGAAIFVDVLNELGVDCIFGHTGGAIIPVHVEFNQRLKIISLYRASYSAARRAGPAMPPRAMRAPAARSGSLSRLPDRARPIW